MVDALTVLWPYMIQHTQYSTRRFYAVSNHYAMYAQNRKSPAQNNGNWVYLTRQPKKKEKRSEGNAWPIQIWFIEVKQK